MSTDLKTLKIFTSYWWRHPWLFLSTLGIGIGFVLQNVISPLFIAQALSQLISHNDVQTSTIVFATLSLLGGAALEFVADLTSSVKLDQSTIRDLYNRCFQHLLRQEYSFFTNNFSGSLVTRTNRFVKAYEQLHFTFFLETVGRFLGVAIALVVMSLYNLMLGLIVAILWIVSILLIGFMVRRRMPHRRAATAKESQQTGELADAITNAFTIKTFAGESYEARRFKQVNDKRAQLFARSWTLAIRNGFVVNMLCAVLQLVILIGGIMAVRAGTMNVAIFLLFQVYILRIIESITKASLVMRQFEGVFGDAHEMTELLGREPLIKDPPQPENLRMTKGVIAFKKVTFGYAEQQENEALFDQLNLDIKAGEHIGLVGPSGGGKSTVTRLLLRFHDIADGSIAIDEQDIRAIRQADLHQAISYVPQEPILFHRSLAENIAYGKPDASLAEIQKAARHAHADSFIEQLPNGYDTLVGERGVKLSGGQRQRVAIARAMLKNAPILVLDEATAALDSESERLIQEALWQLMRGKTALVIAHRLSTIQKMDRIVVLDNGRIVEQGTHKQLLKNDKLYAKLWKHQSGGFIED